MQKETPKQPLTLEVRELMRENALDLVEILIQEQQAFRIVIWNNDNWNHDLPEQITEAFPVQIVLDIKQATLEESFIDESTGEVIITTMFEGSEYMKVLKGDEIVAVLDLEGKPYVVNDFSPEEMEEYVFDSFLPTTKEEIIELAMLDGCEKEAVTRSLDVFIKNNPDLAERFGQKHPNNI